MRDLSRVRGNSQARFVEDGGGVTLLCYSTVMSGAVTDGDGLPLFCEILNGNTADCEFNHQMVSNLQSVFGDEFTKYFYIADSKVLNEKNINRIYSNGKPVKIISRVPDNFSKKLSERKKKQAYLDNIWE